MANNFYYVGGSVPLDAPSYIKREADDLFYNYLKNGQYCYVLNSRQMGKSSLWVQTQKRLKEDNIDCATIDLSGIGKNISEDIWYRVLFEQLVKRFDLSIREKEQTWWDERAYKSAINRLDEFVEEILLKEVSRPIVICFDEIDSVLSLKFSTDDFFAWLRSCHEKRPHNRDYQRLTFCMLGVAAVSNFILDNYRSPFNIGQDIRLSGFTIGDARKLAEGLQDKVIAPERVLEEVIEWTGGQPFLTQKICHLISTSRTGFGKESPATPINVGDFIQSQVISNWVSQDSPEHLKTIRNRLLNNRLLNKRVTGRRMLKLYQEILRNGEITDDGSPDQIELRLTGLVVQDRQKLKVYNKIYRNVFNETWVTTELNKIPAYYERVDQLAEILLRTEFDENQRAALIEEIPAWTGGNLELNIIVILLLIDNKNELREGQEKPKIEQLIQKNIVENWLQNKAADHLQKIQNSLLTPDKNVRSRLEIYQEILQGRVFADNKPEKLALQQAELVIKNDEYLEVTNRIYKEVFNVQWVKQELEKLVEVEKSPADLTKILSFLALLGFLGFTFWSLKTPEVVVTSSPSIPEICAKRDFNITLEKNIQQLQDLKRKQGNQFPENCATQLNELRLIQQAVGLATNNFVADVPGREGGFEILCKIPPTSDNFKEAQSWAKSWHNDRYWKSRIDRALQDNPNCQKLIE
ncbi:MAG: AAA-like domain-containing protein [Microcystis sp. M015S2]|uniref:AAA-like domain-containing protein n=1 Tax=unclassified Microcystis TaxID=2643300 RepID=UPI002590E7F6|nr:MULTISPECIES: AAA-like domain-containing protein [unclassified Microcystis]MCA2711645.1 AAA-like domain-containing protein [Microcystis sp. M025S2]MCA2743857.1 AAA-like domain-containing protein [Microcystis sp. M015S2]MCA2757758.1 AAA-like domain-containing protein [Microcystis sp. M145S2]